MDHADGTMMWSTGDILDTSPGFQVYVDCAAVQNGTDVSSAVDSRTAVILLG